MLHVKVNRINIKLLILGVFLTSLECFSQQITEIPKANVFSPEFEAVESAEFGVNLYDQYAGFKSDPKTRIDGSGNLVNGKIEDFTADGKILHKGFYQDGILRGYTNFYQNEAIERNYKYKSEGLGDLFVYYQNGYTRSVQKYANFRAYHWEDYHENGNLAYLEVRNKKSFIPESIQENDFKGNTLSLLEISDNKKLKYIKTVYWANGKLSEQGELTYIEDMQDFRKDGRWVTYNTQEKVTSEVVYQIGEMTEVISDTRPMSERTYLNKTTTAQAPVSSVVEDGFVSKMPANIAQFDRNKDNEISNKEIDMAVNDFFEDDSITRQQINDLVNFFFEQD